MKQKEQTLTLRRMFLTVAAKARVFCCERLCIMFVESVAALHQRCANCSVQDR